ncbi:hypothetical protein AAJ76_210000706 [Vairimorpha ceranae]|uniref:Uncharacterized protein n=1 Tax=Vairimorpha ceranae TaxID=40302 RepID=A0A0F9Z7C0_9MICR|nr:hypothetical protein AAJ76_210000706 [Vairimorpha ceranae]KKO73834.1 hypothetical protein AAJ76_210000706 [Vairimorpha ceranae]
MVIKTLPRHSFIISISSMSIDDVIYSWNLISFLTISPKKIAHLKKKFKKNFGYFENKAFGEDTKNYIRNPDEIIEIDESKIGKRKYIKEHLFGRTWIFGLVKEEISKKVWIRSVIHPGGVYNRPVFFFYFLTLNGRRKKASKWDFNC